MPQRRQAERVEPPVDGVRVGRQAARPADQVEVAGHVERLDQGGALRGDGHGAAAECGEPGPVQATQVGVQQPDRAGVRALQPGQDP